jgi:hypothetical protein
MPLIGTVSTTQAIYGSQVPTNDVGQDGDIYVQSVDAIVLGVWKKESGQWNEIGDVNASDWVPFTPTIYALSGTITTIGVTDCRYKLLGKTCNISMAFTITTNGTGAGAVLVDRPEILRASARQILPGEQFITVAKSCVVDIVLAQRTAYFYLYDGTYPGGDNTTLASSGFFDVE